MLSVFALHLATCLPRRSCLIVGSRGSGKTALVKERHPKCLYATLDDPDHLAWAKGDPKGFISHLGIQAVIDEIEASYSELQGIFDCKELAYFIKFAR